ncbi:E3 ubiquitin-protein ligase RGLG4-like [Vigna umbellata]|uniref:E3 ubiquitin-protein ligase RGLG4-like n=1 Tax=Vigna umbellata TaxID=87088 RepID=UPI001F5E86D5|nr:E3 ubiquitin-protein ligase RGLG4-like [Vigna umbellata]
MTKFNELPWRRVTGRAKRIVPKAPPLPYSRLAPSLTRLPTTAPPSSIDDNNQSICPVCLTNPRDLAFGCGHMVEDARISVL